MPTNNPPAEDTSNREIIISRVVHAPRELVWEVWTNPLHVAKWWGPRGFTTTTKRHEFRVGGVWEHTMHGPDGTNYPNKSVFKEIVPQKRIVFSHGGGREDGEIPGANFTATWTFEIVETGKTKVTGRMLFPTATARNHVVREFGAIEGGRQTLERLAEQLAAMRCEPFIVAHEFAAPRDLVWRAWTEPEHFSRWFGPKGAKLLIAKFEVKPGGTTLFSMTMPDGQELWVKAVYREIAPPTKLVWVTSPSDKDGGITPRPMWPRERLTIVTFTGNAGKTTVTVTWLPLDATADEIIAFNASRAGAAAGWSGPFEKLAAYLTEIQPPTADMNSTPTPDCRPFVISREFAAPRDVVWRAWTERDQFGKWFGPKGMKLSLAKFDLRPGGLTLYSIMTPDGKEMWGKAVYREITPMTKLVWINSFSDKDAGITRHPFTKDPWPLQMLTVVTFAEQADKTTVTVNWVPYEADADERGVFDRSHESMKMGWGGTFEQLGTHLAQFQSGAGT